ncbi:polysaccharide deacetylase family protein [Roseomonas sp. BN140053]|uniref:polysaccharide deacetylase family protein n=1 Tax=Roseomonas sp. BN140053 TaxID=3391898 RepID=UPI0039EB455E
MFDLTLSFDNGPEPEVTPAVLDVLRARGLRATFFTIGQKLARPEGQALSRRAHDEGHWIGNHTWTHSVPFGERREPDLVEQELVQTERAIGDLAHPRRLFRPFGGGGNLDARLLNPAVLRHLQAQRYTCVLWNAVPRDWADPEGWCDTALAQCQAQPWTLMVLHDLPTGAMRHLDRFLGTVAERGGRIRQDFPPDCVPIAEGQVVRPIDGYVTQH